MKLSEKIEAAEQGLVTLKDALTTATEALEAAPDEESLLAEVEELADKVERSTNTLQALKKAEKALASRAVPAGDNGDGKPEAPSVIRNMKDLRDPKGGGELMWKHATAKLIGYVERKSTEQVIEERYADDRRVKETYNFVTKAAVQPAMTNVAAWAGELVREDTRGFIESLTEVSVAAALTRYCQNFSFDGFGSIKIPMENGISANPTEPAWVGEGGVIPLTSFGLTSMKLEPYKLAAITTMTRETVERSTPAIESIVQNLLRKSYAKVLDHALLDPAIAAVAGVRPASLTNAVTATTAGAGTADENVRADILALLNKHTTANIGARPVLIANNQNVLAARMMVNAMGEFLFRDELGSGQLLSLPVISSGHVPANRLIMVDAEYVATAFGSIEFDVSEVATVTEADAGAAAPTQAESVGTPGAIGNAGEVPSGGGIEVGTDPTATFAVGRTTRSLWQTYSLGMRMVSQTSFGKMNPAAVQYIATIDWS